MPTMLRTKPSMKVTSTLLLKMLLFFKRLCRVPEQSVLPGGPRGWSYRRTRKTTERRMSGGDMSLLTETQNAPLTAVRTLESNDPIQEAGAEADKEASQPASILQGKTLRLLDQERSAEKKTGRGHAKDKNQQLRNVHTCYY